MKLQKMKGGAYFLCMPLAIVKAKHWKKKDNIEATINNEGDIVLKKNETER